MIAPNQSEKMSKKHVGSGSIQSQPRDTADDNFLMRFWAQQHRETPNFDAQVRFLTTRPNDCFIASESSLARTAAYRASSKPSTRSSVLRLV